MAGSDPFRLLCAGSVKVRAALALSLAILTTAADAAEPVRQVGVYVRPYYSAAADPGGQPSVHVGAQYDALLASNDASDLRKVRDLIESKPELVTPMTLMVLAIRLYDVGMRDDSVFWFYVAKDRYMSLTDVIDESSLGEASDAIQAFATLAGPVINGYAFCDVDKQVASKERAWKWVAAHPYQAAFLPQLQAKPGDRGANLAQSIEKLRQSAEQERTQLADPDFRKDFRANRLANGTDARFCWK